MKKLMIAASAALCAAVGFGVESANIVGYTDKPLTIKRKQIVGVPFTNVSGGELDIQSIKPLNNGAAIGEGEATIWWYDTTLSAYQYAYWTEDLYEDDGTEEGKELGIAGWCEDTETLFVTEKTFAAGEGFFILPNDGLAKPSIQMAGEVVAANTATVVAPLVSKRKQLINNPFPVDVDIQDIIPLNNGAAIGEGEATVWWYDTTASAYKYAYWTEDLYEDDGTEEGKELGVAGWCEDTETLFVTQKTVASGEGFFILPNDGLSKPQVSFPNPLYVGE